MKRKTKKTFWVTFLSVAMLAAFAAGFAGCSKKDDDNSTPWDVDTSDAIDYKSEYVWNYSPEFSDPCDENIIQICIEMSISRNLILG